MPIDIGNRRNNKRRFSKSPSQRLRIAYLSLHRVSDACFLKHGVTADQFVLLSTLVEEEGINQKELSLRLSSDQNTVTAMIRLLESRKTIYRKIPDRDRRSRSVYITEKGRKLQKILLVESRCIHRALDKLLPKNEMDAFLAALDRLPSAIAEAGAGFARKRHRQ